MNRQTTIFVAEIFDKRIHTRDAARMLFQSVTNSPWTEIVFDFANVSFISRSFADEFFFKKTQVANEEKKNIKIINAEGEVLDILKSVAKTQVNFRQAKVDSIPVIKYSSSRDLDFHLVSI
jgi:hypothetical protein